MRSFPVFFFAALLTLAASAASAQDQPLDQPQHGFVEGIGAITLASGVNSGALGVNLGVRVAPHVFVTGAVGQMRDVDAGAFNEAVATVVSTAATNDLTMSATSRTPVTYVMGGVRVQTVTLGRRFTPYVSGGFGLAHISPTASFVYASGTANGALTTTPSVGSDITTQLTTLGYYTEPTTENHAMLGLGGGVDVMLARNVNLNLAYRYSRIFATSPINISGPSFALGFRF
jgi:opacity protein-like surface antigen